VLGNTQFINDDTFFLILPTPDGWLAGWLALCIWIINRRERNTRKQTHKDSGGFLSFPENWNLNARLSLSLN
jgi:hypothetical protein